MNESHRKLIRERYENAVHEYSIAFCQKHGYSYNPDALSCGVVGGVLFVANKYIGFLQINDDIDNDIVNDIPVVQDCLAAQTDEMNFIDKGGKA